MRKISINLKIVTRINYNIERYKNNNERQKYKSREN